jgi:hypothetical protein
MSKTGTKFKKAAKGGKAKSNGDLRHLGEAESGSG